MLPWLDSVVQVFQHCQPQVSVGMAVFWQGVVASEVFSACRMLHVQRRDWPRHLHGVQFMARVVANIQNERSQKKD